MKTEIVRVPVGVLAAPGRGALPESSPLRRMIDPSVILAGLSIGIIVLTAGFDEPPALLVLSASLNGTVMFLYSGLLLWPDLTSFRGPLRPHPVRILALVASLLFFGYFSALTLGDQLTKFV